MNLAELDDRALIRLWAAAMRELRTRGLTRSANNPVADYGERLAAEHLGLTLAGKSVRSYDATDADGLRYQIKARRITPENPSRQLSFLRRLDQREFDFLVVVLFDETLDMLGMWKLPHGIIAKYARWDVGTNAHILVASPRVLSDPAVERLV